MKHYLAKIRWQTRFTYAHSWYWETSFVQLLLASEIMNVYKQTQSSDRAFRCEIFLTNQAVVSCRLSCLKRTILFLINRLDQKTREWNAITMTCPIQPISVRLKFKKTIYLVDIIFYQKITGSQGIVKKNYDHPGNLHSHILWIWIWHSTNHAI